MINNKTIILHCKKLEDRKEHMISQMEKFGFSDYEFYEDYDVNELNSDIIDEHYKSFKNDKLAWRSKVDLFGTDAHTFHPKRCNKFEISLTIKLGKVFEKLSKLDFDNCIIFEDDAVLCEDFDNKFKDFLSKTPDDWDVIYFGECSGLHFSPIEENKVAYLKKAPYSRGCAGMIFKKKTIDDLASNWFPFNLVSDWEIACHHHRYKHNVYWWEPTLVKQGSEIGLFESSLRNISSHRINYFTYCNYSYIELTKNLILSFVKNVSSGALFVFCSNIRGVSILNEFISEIDRKEKSIYILHSFNDDIIDVSSDYNTENFIKISQEKFKLVLTNIERYDNIFFVDSDVIFLGDPFEHLKEYPDCDIIFQNDNPITNPVGGNNWVCTGNFFCRKTDNTINFLKTIVSRFTPNKNDQDTLKDLLDSHGETIYDYPNAKLEIFNPSKMQNGFDAFRSNWYKKPETIMVHVNWIVGMDNKINLIKNSGLWFEEE